MATNFHADLPNDQIHPPKDFSTANNSSVMAKDINGDIIWPPTGFTLSTTVSCTADVSGNLHNRSFYVFYSTTTSYQLYVDVDAAGGFSPSPGYTGVRVSISANDTNITVAAAVKTALDGLGGFTTSVDGAGKVTFSGMTNTKNTEEVDSGFGFSNTKTYSGTQVLYSDSSGSVEWKNTQSIISTAVHWNWTCVFSNKSSSGNNDWHWINAAGMGNPHANVVNVGTPTPTVVAPIIGNNALIFQASRAMTLNRWHVVMTGTTAAEVVTIKLFKATPATGTGNWTLTDIDTVTDTLGALECKFGTGSSGASLAAGDILLPAIKVDRATSGLVTYQNYLDLDYV